MSIFAPSRPGGSAQGFLPPDGRPCKAEKSSHVTPVPPEDVSALGDAAAGTGSGPTGRADPIRSDLGREGGCRAAPAPRSHPWLRRPRRAGQSQRPQPRPLPPPGPAPAPHRCAPKLPCPPGRQRRCGARKRRASAHAPDPPHRHRRPATHSRRGAGGGGTEAGGERARARLRPPRVPARGEERGLPPPIGYGAASPSPPKHCRRRGRDGGKRCACGAGPAESHTEPPAPPPPRDRRRGAVRDSMRLWLGFGLLLSAELSAVSAAVSMREPAPLGCATGCSQGTLSRGGDGTGRGARVRRRREPHPYCLPPPQLRRPALSERWSSQVGLAGMPVCPAAAAGLRPLSSPQRARSRAAGTAGVGHRQPHGLATGSGRVPRDGPSRALALPRLVKERRWLGTE